MARSRSDNIAVTPLARLPVSENVTWLRQNSEAHWLDTFCSNPRRGWLFCPTDADVHPVNGADMLTIADAMGGCP